jgi:hypothetical protein
MGRWAIYVAGRWPKRLGIVTAPDEGVARTKALELFYVAPNQRDQLVIVPVGWIDSF